MADRTTNACPKCRGSMAEGFIPSYQDQWVDKPRWVEGPPEDSFWRGTRLKGKAQFPVKTFRCIQCGYLEFYALESADGELPDEEESYASADTDTEELDREACLECGAAMPQDAVRCSSCGWTYKTTTPGA
jgi:ribosomal protein L40E/predicted nucleic-acid-binding Zn-ribbon protein